jgi:hypothetical protein
MAHCANFSPAAAIKILEFQQLVDEEMRLGGLLYPVSWMQSSLLRYSRFRWS